MALPVTLLVLDQKNEVSKFTVQEAKH
jgi:hypothetical protein